MHLFGLILLRWWRNRQPFFPGAWAALAGRRAAETTSRATEGRGGRGRAWNRIALWARTRPPTAGWIICSNCKNHWIIPWLNYGVSTTAGTHFGGRLWNEHAAFSVPYYPHCLVRFKGGKKRGRGGTLLYFCLPDCIYLHYMYICICIIRPLYASSSDYVNRLRYWSVSTCDTFFSALWTLISSLSPLTSLMNY